jgi:hypothetical protein
MLVNRLVFGAAGAVVLAVALVASLFLSQPRLFAVSVPLGAGLILAQGVGSTVWLARLRIRQGQPVPAWLMWAQAAAALLCWLVLVWIFWLRS